MNTFLSAPTANPERLLTPYIGPIAAKAIQYDLTEAQKLLIQPALQYADHKYDRYRDQRAAWPGSSFF